MGAFTKLFSRLKLTSDPAVTTQTATVIQADSTNSSLVIAPNGTGALVASIPDGTTTGGNARGQYAVDLQQTRGNIAEVASGNYSFIGGGRNNRATGTNSSSFGAFNQAVAQSSTAFGESCQATNSNTVAGGSNSIASGNTSISFGSGNTASSNFSVVSGGQSNTASTNTHATVVGGQSNTSSGAHSISGGQGNTATGVKSISLGNGNNSTGTHTVCIGNSNSASATNTFSLGAFCTANVNFATALGNAALAYLYGTLSNTSGIFASVGDAQQSLLTARREATLTTAATTVLSLDGTGTTNLIIPNGNNRAWNVQIDTIAIVTAITGTATGVTVGDCYMQKDCLLFKRIGGTSSIVGSIDTTSIKNDTSMATCAIDINSGASQQLEIVFNAPSFSGGGSVTFRIVSKVALVEVAY